MIAGSGEPAGSGEAGMFLISVVAIHGSGASAATISPPTSPEAWTPIGDWACNNGFGSEIHMAAAYRFTDENDGPGVGFTWTFSAPFEGSVVNTVYSNVNTLLPIDALGAPACASGNAGSVVVAPAITTTVANDLLVSAFAGAGAGNDLTLTVGSPFGPVASQSNGTLGPAGFNAFASTTELDPVLVGSPGAYGPYTAIQGAAGESIAILIGLALGQE